MGSLSIRECYNFASVLFTQKSSWVKVAIDTRPPRHIIDAGSPSTNVRDLGGHVGWPDRRVDDGVPDVSETLRVLQQLGWLRDDLRPKRVMNARSPEFM